MSSKCYKYNMTYHEYVVLHYNKRVDKREVEENLKKHSHIWTVAGKIDDYKFQKFVTENLHLIVDADLFKKVTLEARKVFDVHHDDPVPELLSDEYKKLFFDFDHKYDGANFLLSNSYELALSLQKFYKTNKESVYHKYSEYEQAHFDKAYEYALRNSPVSEPIQFIEMTINDDKFSDLYKSSLLFLLNDLKFLASGDLNLTPNVGLTTAGESDIQVTTGVSTTFFFCACGAVHIIYHT